MLFDLRSRGRRRTVQIIYIGLAVLIGAGLILFGVGTGSGGGGLFGAFTGSGSSNSSNSAVSKATKSAIAQTKAHPQSPAAWAALVNARYTQANQGYDSNANTYTSAGKQQLGYVIQAYEKYSALTHQPSANTATIAAKAYSQLGQYSKSADTYQTVLAAQPGNLHGLECVSLESFAAGNTRVATLAESRTLAKLPKAARSQVKAQLEAAKKTPTIAAQSC
jgi:tetratricopeptide (TPR) repeat protein